MNTQFQDILTNPLSLISWIIAGSTALAVLLIVIHEISKIVSDIVEPKSTENSFQIEINTQVDDYDYDPLRYDQRDFQRDAKNDFLMKSQEKYMEQMEKEAAEKGEPTLRDLFGPFGKLLP